MILFSLVYLVMTFIYLFFNIYSFVYIGIFFLTTLNLFYYSLKIFWSIYYFWLNEYNLKYNFLLWIDIVNIISIFFNTKEFLILELLTFIMVFVVIITSVFVFFFCNYWIFFSDNYYIIFILIVHCNCL